MNHIGDDWDSRFTTPKISSRIREKVACRKAGFVPMIENLFWDARLALRTLTRSPGFSAVAIVLMTLGIATTTTLFSLTYGVLLKPLPWSDPDRIVRLQEMRGRNPGRVPWTITNTTYHAWGEQPTTIEAIGGWTRTRVANVTVGGGAPERLRVASVTPSLFRTVAVAPVAGRVFSDEDVSSGLGAIVLGFDIWQRRFGGSADVLGQTLRLDGSLVTIIGEENPSLTLDAVAMMEDLLTDSLARPRTYVLLIAGFALFATAVALVGLFGVLSLMAAQRTREIGVRTALGATPSDILGLVSRQAVVLTVTGLVLGLTVASALAQSLSSFLFGVTAHDPATFMTIPLFLLFAAAAASVVPAYRAARVNPIIALRSS